MSDHDKPTSSEPPSGWPGGWYVYENGKVEGPYSAEETFQLSSETSDGKPRLVSRKGFSQWYALRDLSEIFRVTDQFGKKVRAHSDITEAQLAAAQAKITGAPVSPKAFVTPTAAAPFAPTPLAASSTPVVSGKQIKVEAKKPVILGAAAEVSARIEAHAEPQQSAQQPPQPQASQPAATKTGAKVKPQAVNAQTRALVLQEYFLARGKLRLGKLRNPWISAFVGFPLTIGVLWAFWMRDLAREVSFHARNTDKTAMPSAVFALFPIVHIYMTYKLASAIVEMEAQNRYRSISPSVAALFSLFPPFAMAYLQDAANRHWLLHVKHAMVKKKNPDE